MEELARNNRSLAISTVIMLAIMLAIIIFGMVLFPMQAYFDPNAGPIRGLVDSPGGNVLVIAMFGVLACNIAFFLNTVIRLERERAAILERATAQAEAPKLPPNPPHKAIGPKPTK